MVAWGWPAWVIKKICHRWLRDTAVYLCDDIIIEILSRLPTSDLCRWKCVSKRWRLSLVPSVLAHRSNLAFLTVQLGKYDSLCFPDDVLVYQDSQYRHRPFLSIINLESQELANILCVCNGATLLSIESWRDGKARKGGIYVLSHYVVYNPFTRKISIVKLPPYNNIGYSFTDDLGLLAFDPRISSHHFKIVSHIYGHQPFIYSSKTNKWRPFKLSLPPTHYIVNSENRNRNGPYLDLPDHISYKSTDDYANRYSYCINGRHYKIYSSLGRSHHIIVSLDVNKEDFKSICCPEGDYGEGSRNDIITTYGETAGRICFAELNCRSMSLLMWALRADWKWELRHNVGLQAMEKKLPTAFTTEGFKFYLHPVDDESLFITQSHIVRLYNFNNSELTEITNLTKEDHFSVYNFCPYVSPH